MFLMGFVLAVWTGLEPATPCVTGRYSNQLNYQTNDFMPVPIGTPATAGFKSCSNASLKARANIHLQFHLHKIFFW